jgi:fructokinase
MESINKHRVVCFGEILWDILPSGAVPGGAPMNVAYHLYKQNLNPALITKIGIDDEGKKLVDIFSNNGVCTDYFQVDYEYETGKVYATPNVRNEVSYNIAMPVAWDFIQQEDGLKELVDAADVFVFGSLAARNKVSYDTLFSLLEIAKNKVLDINLRAPHFNKQVVKDLLEKADFVKMNQDELELITGWFADFSSTEDRMKSLAERFSISNMIVTMGGDGAILLMDGEMVTHKGFTVDVEDTVGSGDAFLAGLLSKLLNNTEPKEALDFASRLGAFIATQRGGCPEYKIQDIENLCHVPNL